MQARRIGSSGRWSYCRNTAQPTSVIAGDGVLADSIEDQTGWSIRKSGRTARRYRTVEIEAGRHIRTAADPLPDDLREAIAQISGQLEHQYEPTRSCRFRVFFHRRVK